MGWIFLGKNKKGIAMTEMMGSAMGRGGVAELPWGVCDGLRAVLSFGFGDPP